MNAEIIPSHSGRCGSRHRPSATSNGLSAASTFPNTNICAFDGILNAKISRCHLIATARLQIHTLPQKVHVYRAC